MCLECRDIARGAVPVLSQYFAERGNAVLFRTSGLPASFRLALISNSHDLRSPQPHASRPPALTLGRFLLRVLRGAATGVSVGFVLYFLVSVVLFQLTEDEGWIYGMFFLGGVFVVFVMPIVGALVELVIVIRAAPPPAAYATATSGRRSWGMRRSSVPAHVQPRERRTSSGCTSRATTRSTRGERARRASSRAVNVRRRPGRCLSRRPASASRRARGRSAGAAVFPSVQGRARSSGARVACVSLDRWSGR